MMDKTFKALIVSEKDDSIISSIEDWSVDRLSEGDTLVEVEYSAINYKDALATIKNGGVIRSYPMIPGIDFSGTIIETTHEGLSVGDRVVVTGQGTGVSHTGGFSEIARIPGEWIQVVPQDLDLKVAAFVGTAGITAAQAIHRLESVGLGENKESSILITGATGGVGSMAINSLKAKGFNNITALTRKKSTDYLDSLGVQHIISTEEILENTRPLQKQLFDYVIDTIGGATLEAILPKISYGGGISLCGNASGIKFSTTVLPFILRGVTMFGIDSVQLTTEEKSALWDTIKDSITKEMIDATIANEISLEDIVPVTKQLLEGTHSGRTIVKIK
ncbi:MULTISPECIES: YhdH/YhfP family quinone oxidoreductase [Enterococcaceae]|uniref:YhdH/YhfP family quinone oxidoreductase n=1 Tax=Enterococcaceae TaxID=81852 RepID=UPI001F231312|nr:MULTISPECIES: YhdH/YhfP family quinone oxidoreductase [Enterococcaceae]MCI0130353.1 YhdH/YhfP family quinone oxidoreductase [Vagococcus sp. CY53-2]